MFSNLWKTLLFLFVLIFLQNCLYIEAATVAMLNNKMPENMPITTKFNCSQPPILENNFDINQCCRLPEINLRPAIEKCQKHIKSLKSFNPQYPIYAHMCYPQCIYRETNALRNDNDDEEIQIENVKSFLETNMIQQRDKIIIPTIVESFEICLANIKQHMLTKNMKSLPKFNDQECSPYASIVYGCVNAETFVHCPMEMWKNETSCQLAKSFTEQCNPLPHVPMPI